jgi:hypothetical protein
MSGGLKMTEKDGEIETEQQERENRTATKYGPDTWHSHYDDYDTPPKNKKGIKKHDRAFRTGWDIVKTQINRVKSPSPDADAGSHKCRECDNQGGALPCKSCGYMKTPTGKQRQTKPSQRNNKNYQILRSVLEKKKNKWGYKSDRGQRPIPKLPTPKKDKNKIK